MLQGSWILLYELIPGGFYTHFLFHDSTDESSPSLRDHPRIFSSFSRFSIPTSFFPNSSTHLLAIKVLMLPHFFSIISKKRKQGFYVRLGWFRTQGVLLLKEVPNLFCATHLPSRCARQI